MTVSIAASGDAARAVETVVPQLVADLVASGITAQDPELWGPDAESEAAERLGWVEAVAVSTPLVAEITALRESLAADGVDHVVLAGAGEFEAAQREPFRRFEDDSEGVHRSSEVASGSSAYPDSKRCQDKLTLNRQKDGTSATNTCVSSGVWVARSRLAPNPAARSMASSSSGRRGRPRPMASR